MKNQPTVPSITGLSGIHRGATKQPLRVFEVALFAALPLEVFGVFGFPVNEIAAATIVLVALVRVPVPSRTKKWWIPALVLLWAWFLFGSFLAPADLNPRRLVHLIIWAMLLSVIAAGRIHYQSMISGLGFGLLVGSVSGLLKLGGGGAYEGRLTGYFGDPNVAGLVLVLYGLVAWSLKLGRWQVPVLAVSAVALVLTLSRTSLLALGFGLLWFILSKRIRWYAALGLFAVLVPLVFNLVEQFKNWGPFADRAGSDELRERIIAGENALIAQRPLFGNGAGTAHIDVGGMNFFFHNSYLALQAEFGLIAVLIYLVVAVLIMLMLVRLPRKQRNLPLEMAIIALGICALNLGEVLVHLPSAVLFGAAIRWAVAARAGAKLVESASVDVRKGDHDRIR